MGINMVAENDQIELRSEKVRSIIGQIPPLLLRSGIGIIFIITLILSCMGYYFKYPYTIEAEYYIWENNHKPEGALMVPYGKASRIKPDQRVIINLTNVSFMYNKTLLLK
ncbi:MAG: hypothetical protein HC830_03250 [Bacteroidetes bacterium]|nr:hypothetical protein [Bacteroidota bacterium]